MQQSARASSLPLAIKFGGNCEGVGIQLDHGIDRRSMLVDIVDPILVLPDQRMGAVFARRHGALQIFDRHFVQLECRRRRGS